MKSFLSNQWGRLSRFSVKAIAFLVALVIGFVVLMASIAFPAILFLISSALISLPIWTIVSWILWSVQSSYLPETWWDGWRICVLILFVGLCARRLIGADSTSKG